MTSGSKLLRPKQHRMRIHIITVLQVMGCTSHQYASMERYLVGKALALSEKGWRLIVVYENIPRSEQFVNDLREAAGVLECGKLRVILDFSFFGQIHALIKKWKIDIVHGYFTPTCYAVALALRLTGFSHVVRSATNLPFGIDGANLAKDGRPTFRARLRHRALALLFQKILCRSDGVAEAFRQLGVRTSRLAVADGGCDTECYFFSAEARRKLRGELGIGEKELVLGACCRLVPVKRLDRLIRLVAGVGELGVALRLLIAGDGPDRSRLKALTAELDRGGRIRFLGHRDDLAQLYSAFDVFCLPSQAEGMSNSILEAMASRLPVLATDIAPNRGLVQAGKNGYLLSFEDLNEFKDIFWKLQEPGTRKAMGNYGRKLVKTHLSLASRIKKEIAVYEEVLK
jgi:glycosyltransferase involved in cell wall biosynthesis